MAVTTKSPVAAKILTEDPLAMISRRDQIAITMAAAIRGSNVNLAPTDVAHRAFVDADALMLASHLPADRLSYREVNGRIERVKSETAETQPATSAEHGAGNEAG